MDVNFHQAGPAGAYQQNQQQPPNGASASRFHGQAMGAPPMGIMQQRMHEAQQQHQQHQFSGGVYSQGTPTGSIPAPQQTQFATPATVNPSRNFSPYGSTSTAQSHTSRSPSLSGIGPLHTTMAAPITSNPLQPGTMQSPIKTSIPLPNQQSPEMAARDQERVTLLLEINQILLQEIVNLQEAGKGGDVQSPAKTGDGNGEKDKPMASQEYVECMRRMQSNLAYLANVAERSTRPTQQNMPWPPLMGVPTTGPAQLPEMYIKLQNMFPAWKAQQAQQKAGNLSPGPGSSGGTPGGGQ